MKGLVTISIIAAALLAVWYYKSAQKPAQVPAQQPGGVPPDQPITMPTATFHEDIGTVQFGSLPVEGTGTGGFSGWRSNYSNYPDTSNNIVTPGAVKVALNPNLEAIGGFDPSSQLRRAFGPRFNY
jgi:hypothetical protein